MSDTSVLVALVQLRLLHVLHQLHGEVLIPPAVRDEFAAGADETTRRAEFLAAPWVRIRAPREVASLGSLARGLDCGEIEAIALALEMKADLLLIDERRGRRAALAAGLEITGVVGILIAAKAAGLIPVIRPSLDQLRSVFSFHIADEVYRDALARSGETAEQS